MNSVIKFAFRVKIEFSTGSNILAPTISKNPLGAVLQNREETAGFAAYVFLFDVDCISEIGFEISKLKDEFGLTETDGIISDSLICL